MTNRKRSGSLDEIISSINQYTQGWINYYKKGELKAFLAKQMTHLRRRLRALIWKRWKKVSTKYRQLKARGASHREAMTYANSRKSYWRISESKLLHRIFTKEKFKQWKLKDFNEILEK
ncbi:reverse transcriptase [Tetragenococcus koreensis]|uniref:group II intron maturase-specific domain-containing protein n=1 Tax=Tetragenococcus koreensis TaxID=290335 RepID=UPI000F4DE169|nr:group II intron maturase-specific domain-containing protein [Tetragenococcus koreensis]AYW44582.1 reverse transcriptase [Tetragenococcus koreensis]AYW44913.1 reverse transcriptase [Tetragenococcus koreensis]AYW45647.1 reverse transcriptase [Tetragenococcus koreensis]AYW45840.1 reverse transcriptase [Tetragenococcus koreensis]AYW46091.1 reverse transcriptase [Tetragenococcus koreensis]